MILTSKEALTVLALLRGAKLEHTHFKTYSDFYTGDELILGGFSLTTATHDSVFHYFGRRLLNRD